MVLTVLAWAFGIIAALVVLFLIFFVRDQLRLKAKKRRRWALAVGLPARFAALQGDEGEQNINAPDPEISIDIANFKGDRLWLQTHYVPETLAEDMSPEHRRHIALGRIRARLGNITARHMGWQPLDGYTVRDTMAWDASMLVEETRLAHTLGWLTEEEAWGYLFLNGQKMQDCFESWQEFTDAALKGREYSLLTSTGKHASPRLATTIAKAHDNRISSFRDTPWRGFRILGADDLGST